VSPTRIVIFAKAPQSGLAKTRLIPSLGAEGAAELAREMLTRTIRAAIAADVGPVELCATPGDSAVWRGVQLPSDLTVTSQGDGDLGVRMARAAARALDAGEAVLLIGTDCLEMGPALLRMAASQLHRRGTTIHPSTDGGYVLLGLTRSDPALFAAIAWGTSTVAAETIARIHRLGWPLHIGAALHDIDEPADLAWLPMDGPPPIV